MALDVIPFYISIIFLVDCQWTKWVCGDCLASCGESALKNCYRKIRRPAMESESGDMGAECKGESFKTMPCEDLEPCPRLEIGSKIIILII